MPLTVVTLSKAPLSLRGDLSKWMQEIAPGVYVGNFNSKVREELWLRVTESVRYGEATLSYAFRNEIGYQFMTHNTESKVIEFDGIPLVMFPCVEGEGFVAQETGFSDASKRRSANRFSSTASIIDESEDGKSSLSTKKGKPYVAIDIETDGLKKENNRIIEIGAVKIENNKLSYFSTLIQHGCDLPEDIILLTGIENELLAKEGITEKQALIKFKAFIQDLDLVGYNIGFDLGFLNESFQRLQMEPLKNNVFDLLKFVKREKMFLDNYKLETVLKDYGINGNVPHRALLDAELILELSQKLTKFQVIMN